MGTRAVPPDDALEGELAALRARAYGVDADIEDDPRAAARLAELEAWRAGDRRVAHDAVTASADPARRPDDAPPSPDTRRRAMRGRVRAFAAGATGVAAVALAVASWFALQVPQPDAVLRESPVRDREQVQRLADYARVLLVVDSTLQGHGSFRGVQLWTATSMLGNRCLLAIEPVTDTFLGADCVPPDADPTITIYDVPTRSLEEWHEGLPRGTVVRFVLSGDVVTVWVHEGSPPG